MRAAIAPHGSQPLATHAATTYLSIELLGNLDAWAARTGRTRADAMRALLEDALVRQQRNSMAAYWGDSSEP